jgi:hypothetical protein
MRWASLEIISSRMSALLDGQSSEPSSHSNRQTSGRDKAMARMFHCITVRSTFL